MNVVSTIGRALRFGWYILKDLLRNGTNAGVYGQLRELRRTLGNYREGKLRCDKALAECLRNATERSTFYRKYKGKTLSEFPVLKKLDFIANYNDVRVKDYAEADLHVMSTSGSTGTPFKVVQDRGKRNRVLAELKFFGERAGYRSHEKMIFYRACHPVPFWRMFWSNVWTLDIASMSDEKAQELYEAQKKGCLRAILAYVSTYDVLTKKWLDKGLTGNPTVRAVFTGAAILTEEVRERCEKFWPNAKVLSRYSNQENGIIAQENGTHNEYEINWASYYVELLKMDSDEPAADGDVGRIVITDMYNRAFPMIRYDTGDLGAIRHRDNDWPVLCRVEGRRVDLIYATNGSIVSPHMVSVVFWGVKNIRQWQFIQEGKSSYRVKYIVDSDPTEARASLDERVHRLRTIFGEDATFEFEIVDAIPMTSSRKFKVVVQNMKLK